MRHKLVYERELMAIVFAVQKWRPYLIGHKFVVRTDQKSLKFLLEQRLVAVEHQKWITKLLGYDFVVEYRAGVENKAADALSRRPEEVFLVALSIPQVNMVGELYQQVQKDKSLCKLMSDLERDQDSHLGYTLVQGRLMFKGRLVVPQGASIITTLLKEYHDGPICGHSWVLKTYKRLRAGFYWVGMKK